jgi:hypothetical protein
MSIRSLAKALGISPTRVAQLIRRGMPTDPEQAKAWRMSYVAPPPSATANVVAMDARDTCSDEGDLSATLARLGRIEAMTAATLEALLAERRLPEAAIVRREYSAVAKSLYDARSKQLKFDQERGKLVTLDRALTLISDSLAEGLIMLRQIPGYARDEAQKLQLKAAVNDCLQAFKEGANRNGVPIERGRDGTTMSSETAGAI